MPSTSQLKAVGVRLGLCLHFVLVVWRVTVSWTDHYWLLATAIVPLLVEGIYTVVKRNGVEWKLFSFCFFFYLGATLPGIWLLEIHKTMTYQSQNISQVEDIVISGVDIPLRLSPDTWVLVVEEMMLYFMILGRWLLPRGNVGREQLTQLLFGFIGIASDIMELFSLFDEDSSIRHNPFLTYVILGVWSLSVLQFTLTFATAHRPRRARGLRMSAEEFQLEEHRYKRSVLRVELLATVLSLFMQDGPFLAVRLYTTITYNVVTYSLVFFTSKNVLVILLLVYKIFLLCGKICCPKPHKDSDDDTEKLDMSVYDYEREYGFGTGDYGDDDDDEYEEVVVRVRKNRFGNGQALYGQSGELRNRGKEKDAERKRKPATVDAGYREPEKGTLEKKDGRVWRGSGMQANSESFEKPIALDVLALEEPLGFDLGTGQLGELQKVIDGPGTPAKPMEKTKKYDKLMHVEDDSTKVDKDKDKVIEDDGTASNTGAQSGNEEKKTEGESETQFKDDDFSRVIEDLDKISDDSGHPEIPPSDPSTRVQFPTRSSSPLNDNRFHSGELSTSLTQDSPSRHTVEGARGPSGVGNFSFEDSAADPPVKKRSAFVSVINVKV